MAQVRDLQYVIIHSETKYNVNKAAFLKKKKKLGIAILTPKSQNIF